MSHSLGPHELQHARLPYPSLSPRACSNLCSLSQWCHPTISSSVIPFASCLQCFPAAGSLPMSQFFASSVQSVGASASASVLANTKLFQTFKLQILKKLSLPFGKHTLHSCYLKCGSQTSSISVTSGFIWNSSYWTPFQPPKSNSAIVSLHVILMNTKSETCPNQLDQL